MKRLQDGRLSARPQHASTDLFDSRRAGFDPLTPDLQHSLTTSG
jgi:hypothetical protein